MRKKLAALYQRDQKHKRPHSKKGTSAKADEAREQVYVFHKRKRKG